MLAWKINNLWIHFNFTDLRDVWFCESCSHASCSHHTNDPKSWLQQSQRMSTRSWRTYVDASGLGNVLNSGVGSPCHTLQHVIMLPELRLGFSRTDNPHACCLVVATAHQQRPIVVRPHLPNPFPVTRKSLHAIPTDNTLYGSQQWCSQIPEINQSSANNWYQLTVNLLELSLFRTV